MQPHSCRLKLISVFLSIVGLAALATMPARAASSMAELDRRVSHWQTRLPFCNWPGFAAYPSKFEDVVPDPAEPLKGQCNDGDSVIFNGVVCASGDQRGCDGVRRSQAADGEFWRSPRKVGVFSKDELPFSDDHFLGVWAYVAQTKDKAAFLRWMDWIDGQPRPRVCQDDKCTFGVSDCPMLDMLALLLLESNKVCDPEHKVFVASNKLVLNAEKDFNNAVERIYRIPGSDILRPALEPLKASFNISLDVLRKATENAEAIRVRAATYARALTGQASLIVTLNALVNKEGPGQSDAAVEILLLEKFVGVNAPGLYKAAEVLAQKQPENPFFEYVAHGATQRMLDQILAKCPAPENDPPHARFQWTWERADSEPAFRKTMYWDCLAVANFYKHGVEGTGAGLVAPDLRDQLRSVNQAVDNASVGVDAIIDAIDHLVAGCRKLNWNCVGSILTAPLAGLGKEVDRAGKQIAKGEVPAPIGLPLIPGLPAGAPANVRVPPLTVVGPMPGAAPPPTINQAGKVLNQIIKQPLRLPKFP